MQLPLCCQRLFLIAVFGYTSWLRPFLGYFWLTYIFACVVCISSVTILRVAENRMTLIINLTDKNLIGFKSGLQNTMAACSAGSNFILGNLRTSLRQINLVPCPRLIWAVSSSICGERIPRSACASPQSDQGLHCLLRESLDTLEYIRNAS